MSCTYLRLAPLLAVLALAGCTDRAAPPGHEEGRGVQRLGEASEQRVFGGIARPVVLPGTSDLELAAEQLPEGRLLLAAAATPEPDAAEPESLHCLARLRQDGGAWRPLVEFAAPAPGEDGPVWATAQAEVPETRDAVLGLSCRPQDAASAAASPEVTWAQPIVVPTAPPGTHPLVVLISLDTLRADHVSGFGADPDLTPNLLRLGQEGLRVTGATSDGTWTRPSHLALFESGYRNGPKDADRMVPLSRAFADAGYATVGITGGGYMRTSFGFGRGFDYYWVPPNDEFPDLSAMLDDATGWIDQVGDAPLFLFVHTYAAHRPSPEMLRWKRTRKPGRPFKPGPRDLAHVVRFYRDLVAGLDADLGPFLEKLRQLSARRPVHLVVASDHGEAFMEHGYYGHGGAFVPHPELNRIPMIVWSPDFLDGGNRDDEPTMLADVAPSLLTAAGVPIPSTMHGRNLWPRWVAASRGTAAPEPADAAQGSVTRNLRSWTLVRDGYKLVVLRSKKGVDRRVGIRLYDLSADPTERVDLAHRQPERTQAMLEQLRVRLAGLGVEEPELAILMGGVADPRRPVARMAQPGEEKVDDATRDQLRALGYVD